jgi:hypothetical protein
VRAGYSYDMNQRLLLESKDRMRSRGMRSPDEWDAVALTFAEPVKELRKQVQDAEPRRFMEIGDYNASTSWLGV